MSERQLTITAGVRHSLMPPIYEANGQQTSTNVSIGDWFYQRANLAAVGAPQSRISTHLGCLRWCGLVQTSRAGKQVYYRIADPRVRDLLALGGAMMRDYAAGIASCGVIR